HVAAVGLPAEDVDGAVEPGGVGAGRADDGEAVGEVDGGTEGVEVAGVEAGEGGGVGPGAAEVVVDEGGTGVRAEGVGPCVSDQDPIPLDSDPTDALHIGRCEGGVGEPGGTG